MPDTLSAEDPALARLIHDERKRLDGTLDLIAAENHPPRSILQAVGSDLNVKTIEGYPGHRFHAGCIHADQVEKLAVERGKFLFNADHINVQPHSGTSANLAVYFSVLDVGDRVLAMGLPFGGHLSHGHAASVTSRCFDFCHYGVDPATEQIDCGTIRALARELKPKMIVAGASAYPRLIDYEKIAGIAREISAYFLVDMAHLAGLVAAKAIPSPVPHCDFATFTCYKTMMGGRGGVILCRKPYAGKIDSAVFPGCQGTSPVNLIAAKALIFKLAHEAGFISIQKKTLENARALADAFREKGYRLVTGGTDNHQVLIDLTSKGISGRSAERSLESAGIILNRNVVPADAEKTGSVSGIRIGSAAVSVRGMAAPEMHRIAELMDRAMMKADRPDVLKEVNESVAALCREFPIP